MSQFFKVICLVLTVTVLTDCSKRNGAPASPAIPEPALAMEPQEGTTSGEVAESQEIQDKKPLSVPTPPKPQVKSTPEDWYDDYNAASAAARQTQRPIFVLFTGSDWCHWCIKLRNDVLNRPEFKKLAEEELILMFADSPNSFELPPNIQQANEMLKTTLGAGGGVPHAIIVSPDGKKLGDISGYRKETDYLKELRKIIRKK